MAPQPLADEFNRLRKQLAEKTTAIKGDEADYTKAAAPGRGGAGEARRGQGAPLPPESEAACELPPLEEAGAETGRRAAAPRGARARRRRARGEDHRAGRGARRTGEEGDRVFHHARRRCGARRRQLAAVAAEIERRVGRGDLDPAKVPDGRGRSDRGRPASARSSTRRRLPFRPRSLNSSTERDALRKPDAESRQPQGAHRRAAGARHRAHRPAHRPEEARRGLRHRPQGPLGVGAEADGSAGRRARWRRRPSPWDMLLRARPLQAESTDFANCSTRITRNSSTSTRRSDNLKQQSEALDKLVELTRKEADDVAKLRAALEKRLAQSEPARQWDAWLAARLLHGLKAEAGVYHDEQARLDACRRGERAARSGADRQRSARTGQDRRSRRSNPRPAARSARLATNWSKPTPAGWRSPGSRSAWCCSRRSSSRD